MPMQWKDESYVRVYTRDTNNWLLFSWEARAVLLFLFRKVDRSGSFEIDPELRGLAKALDMPTDVVQRAIAELTTTRREGSTPTLVIEGDVLYLPNFVEAQEVRRETGAERQAAYRSRTKVAKERARGQMALPMASTPSTPETPTTGGSAFVTDSVTRVVTRNASAVLCCALPAVLGSVRGTEPPREDAGPPPEVASQLAIETELERPPTEREPDERDEPDPPRAEPAEPTETPRETARGTALPASWAPPADLVDALRRELGVDPLAGLQQFRDWWGARPGRQGKSLDWGAQFSADIRRFKKDLPPWPTRAHVTMSPRKTKPTEPHPTAHLAPEERRAVVGGMVAQLEAALGPMNEPRLETHVRDQAFAAHARAPPKEDPPP